MNHSDSSDKSCCKGFWGYAIAVVGAFLIVAGLVRYMSYSAQPPPVNAARADERRKALADLKASNADVLNNYAWQDQGRGFIRIPITNAMVMMEKEWQNPAAARSNLVFRVEKLTAPAPKVNYD
jgi:hypothetical protein